MENSKKQNYIIPIIVMIALFAMIAFVTNLCSPMAVIVKNQFGASNFLSQIGNYGNFIAYLIMGIPSGMLIKRIGYIDLHFRTLLCFSLRQFWINPEVIVVAHHIFHIESKCALDRFVNPIQCISDGAQFYILTLRKSLG